MLVLYFQRFKSSALMSNVKTNNMVTALENLEIRQNVSVFFFYFQGCGQLPQDQHRETDPDAA